MAQTEAQKRAQAKYTKSLYSFNLRFYGTDADIQAHFEAQENKAAYLKRLIREDMERGQS